MKLKDKKGLTLVEMLCTVAILVLVSMVMVLGVQLGVRSYAKSVSYSEAQVLCSTLTTTISDELRYSGTLKVDGSGNVTGFFSQQFGSGDYTAFTTTPEGHVQLGGKDILPAKAYPYGIKAEVESLTYDGVSSLFTVRLSVKDSEIKTLLAETTFEVEKLNVTTEDTAEGRAAPKTSAIQKTEKHRAKRNAPQARCFCNKEFVYALFFEKYDFMRFFLRFFLHVKSKYDKIEKQCI